MRFDRVLPYWHLNKVRHNSTSILVNSKFEIFYIIVRGHPAIEMAPLGGTGLPSSSACPQVAYWCIVGTINPFAIVLRGADPIR